MSEESKSSKPALQLLSIDTESSPAWMRWEELRTPGKHPSRRSYHSAVEWCKSMIIYGGQDLREGVIGELWILNLSEGNEHWEEVKFSTDPGPLCRHVALVHEDKMYVVGGTNFANEACGMHILDLNSMIWRMSYLGKHELPPVDSHSGVVYKSDKDYILIFGGFMSGARSNSIYRMDLSNLTWDSPNIASDKPCPRAGHSAVSYKSYMYIYGGCNEENDRLNDIWRLNLHKYEWEQVQFKDEIPVGRSGHSCVVYHDTMIVFGGMKDLIKETNDMYTLDLKSSTWTQIQSSRMVEDPVSHEQIEEFKRTRASPRKGQLPSADVSFNKKFMNSDLSRRANEPNLRSLDYSISPTKTSISPRTNSPESTLRRRRALYEGPASPTRGRIKQRVPHPRDGHSSVMIGSTMYIFGGDRHQMPFNDVYCFSLEDSC